MRVSLPLSGELGAAADLVPEELLDATGPAAAAGAGAAAAGSAGAAQVPQQARPATSAQVPPQARPATSANDPRDLPHLIQDVAQVEVEEQEVAGQEQPVDPYETHGEPFSFAPGALRLHVGAAAPSVPVSRRGVKRNVQEAQLVHPEQPVAEVHEAQEVHLEQPEQLAAEVQEAQEVHLEQLVQPEQAAAEVQEHQEVQEVAASGGAGAAAAGGSEGAGCGIEQELFMCIQNNDRQ